jgi:phosphoglycolate phosphatase
MPVSFTSSAIEAAIVDLDGTMVDTLGDFVHVLGLMLRDLGFAPVDAATVSRMVGKGSEHLIRSVLAHVLADAGDVEARVDALYALAWKRYRRHYGAANGSHSTVYPGVEEGLRAMARAGWRLACVTNKPTDLAQDLLRAKGLDGFFAFVFGGDAFPCKKPDPLPLLEACKALGSAPMRTLMVGDSSNDVQAARAAGCPVAILRYGYNHGAPPDSAGADMLLDSMAELF